MKSNYKRLGDYIRQVDVRNRDLAVTDLLGVNLNKEFIPSVANTIGTDMSNYKLVSYNQFGCKLMSVERDGKMPVSLYKKDIPSLISSAYYVFEVTNENILSPDYLFMWIKRPEFDRQLWFSSGGDVRGGTSWENLCNMPLFLPSIEEQRKIVAEYQAIERRIENNRRLIAKLEKTAQIIYRNMFVDNIDPENLPQGWRMSTIGEFCKETKSGGTPSRNNPNYWNKNEIRWLKSGEVSNNVIFDTEEFISIEGLKGSSAKIIPSGSVIMAMYGATASQVAFLACDASTNQACCNMITNTFEEAAYLYYHCLFNQEEIKRLANGGAQENLSQELITRQSLLIPIISKMKPFAKIFDTKISYEHEIFHLNKLLSLLLTKLSKLN